MTIGELKFFLAELPIEYRVLINGEPLGAIAHNHELKTLGLACYPEMVTQEWLDKIYEDDNDIIEG